jgi:quercetin dioxygenase-like cupin family protein
VVGAQLLVDLADNKRARHVGEAAGRLVARPQVDGDRLADADRAGAHVVTHAGLKAVGDDEVICSDRMGGERRAGGGHESLAGHRLAVEYHRVAVLVGGRQQLGDGVDRRLGPALSAVNAGDLRRRLHPALSGEGLVVDVQFDVGGAEEVGQREREVVRASERRLIHSPAEGIDVFMLGVDTRRSMMPMLLVFKPGAKLAEYGRHPGEEFVHVLTGKLRLTLKGSEPRLLSAGDSAYYPGDRMHLFANASDRATLKIICVDSPPNL